MRFPRNTAGWWQARLPDRPITVVALGQQTTVPANTEVLPGLWMGVKPDGPLPVHHVLDLWAREPTDMEGAEVYRIHLSDSDTVPDGIDELARWVNTRWTQGGVVLVHCAAGLNRSGLVLARALMLQGWTARRAIEWLRNVRHPLVLCNRAFVDWLEALS